MKKTVLLIINNLHGLPNTTGRCPTLLIDGLSALIRGCVRDTPIANRRERCEGAKARKHEWAKARKKGDRKDRLL